MAEAGNEFKSEIKEEGASAPLLKSRTG